MAGATFDDTACDVLLGRAAKELKARQNWGQGQNMSLSLAEREQIQKGALRTYGHRSPCCGWGRVGTTVEN